MEGKITLTIIKPQAVKRSQVGPILEMINKAGFKIIALKMCKLTKEDASKFYKVHKGKVFYESLIEYMSTGPMVAAILEKNDAVESYRKLIGTTNPEEAADGTIRKIFGETVQRNAVHGSDSDETAIIESHFFFSEMEQFDI